MMSLKVRPFLMFEGKAEEAIRFYVSLFPGGEVTDIVRYGPGGPGPEGSVMNATFTLGGLTVMCTDSFVKPRTPDGGTTLMSLGNYGFSRQFAWVNDRYGVSWPLNLA